MSTKYFSILIVLLISSSINLFAQDLKPAGTKIDLEEQKSEPVENVSTTEANCCCDILNQIKQSNGRCEKNEAKINSPDFSTKTESLPFQVQFVLGGGPSNPEDHYNPGAGLHVGYYLSNNLYLGMTTVVFGDPERSKDYDDEDKNYDDKEIYGQDGALLEKSVVDPKHVLELRVIPWNFGLYFSGGIIYNGVESYDISYNKKARTINGSSYNTGLEASVKYKAAILPSFGFGYNHLFSNGVSLTAGVNVAITHAQTPEVEVSAVNSDTTVADADLAYWEEQIKSNEKRSTGICTIGIGYAF